ncbi:general substrate transporter, partial [Blastocladiella britannica]
MGSAKTYTWFVSFAAALGGFLFGYEIGIINSVLQMNPFQLFFGLGVPNAAGDAVLASDDNTSKTSLIVSFFLLGCIPGALFIAFAADILGRKKSLFLGSFLFTAGGLLQALVPSSLSISGRGAFVMAGRFLGGGGIGILSMAVPLYIAELAPSDIRGRLTSVQQLMITIGIAFASICNAIILSAFGDKLVDNDA